VIAEPSVLKKPVTHTQSTSDGSVVVVTGVPATVVTHLETPDEVSYSLDVAERLEQLISDALTASQRPGAPVFVSWEDGAPLPAYDLELRFRGPGATYGSAGIGFWEKMTTRVNSAFGIVSRSVGRLRGVTPSDPHVAFVGPGSLRIGLRSRQAEPLFSNTSTPDEVSFEALRILAQAPVIIEGQVRDDSLLGSDPTVTHAALRALEVLAPSPRNPRQSVEIIPSPTVFPNVRASVLTADMVPDIRSRRRELAAGSEEHDEIVVEGMIDKVTADGLFHLRGVAAIEGDWGRSKTAEVTFADDQFDEVVGYFRDRSRVRVYGQRELGLGGRERRLQLKALDPVSVDDETRASPN